jgi:Spy/CpxP family protein refolding chaperone
MTVPGKSSTFLLVAALLGGLALGFAGSTLAYRYKLLTVPGTNLLERMNSTLNLTPGQHDEIADIIRDTRDHILDMRRNFQHERRRSFLAAYLRIHALLTPAQQAKFDKDFIPPRFREAAARLERESGAPSESAPSAAPLGSSPSPAAS